MQKTPKDVVQVNIKQNTESVFRGPAQSTTKPGRWNNMSTSCVVTFFDDGEPLCAFYKHSDGALFNKELGDFLDGYKVVNGLPLVRPSDKIANGISCLAAQVIANFKTKPGQIYMARTNDEGDYNYAVSAHDGNVHLTIDQRFQPV